MAKCDEWLWNYLFGYICKNNVVERSSLIEVERSNVECVCVEQLGCLCEDNDWSSS